MGVTMDDTDAQFVVDEGEGYQGTQFAIDEGDGTEMIEGLDQLPLGEEEPMEAPEGDDEEVVEPLDLGEMSTGITKDEADSDPEVDEELQDAIEGNLRLKRLLSREDNADPEASGAAQKKRKTDVDQKTDSTTSLMEDLLTKWGLADDTLTRHVLENLSSEEVENLKATNWEPRVSRNYKSAAELLQMHTSKVKEDKGLGGGPIDMISCFRHKWKLDVAAEKVLRGLCHKDLRYVICQYRGEMGETIEDLLMAVKNKDAAWRTPMSCADHDEERYSYGAAPDALGYKAMSRYTRLELIDPVSNAAVFGDANLTFSLNLAKHRMSLGHVGRVIATTFEAYDVLLERYKEIDETIQTLEDNLSEVYHNVDCTRVAIDPRFTGMAGSLGAVYYNYPHAGAVQGFFDGHPVVNWRHENLMRLFFRALRTFVKPGGIVKVASNASAVGVRYSYIIGAAVENEFEHLETMAFLQWKLHRYGRSYGDRRDTYKRPGDGERYNAQRAESDMVYSFIYKPSGKKLSRQMIRLPPTITTLMGCTDGPFEKCRGEGKKRLVSELYKRFMTECSGTHVG